MQKTLDTYCSGIQSRGADAEGPIRAQVIDSSATFRPAQPTCRACITRSHDLSHRVVRGRRGRSARSSQISEG